MSKEVFARAGISGMFVVVASVFAASTLAQDSKVFSGVHNKGTSTDAGLATDADNKFAVLAPKGWLTLELPLGWQCLSDSSNDGSDIEVYVSEGSSEYRVEVGTDHNKFTEITGKSTGSLAFDVDHHRVSPFRFVRIRNVDNSGSVYLDAVKCKRAAYQESTHTHEH